MKNFYDALVSGLPKPKSLDEKMKEGASAECGIAGSMSLREFTTKRVDYPTRSGKENDDAYS